MQRVNFLIIAILFCLPWFSKLSAQQFSELADLPRLLMETSGIETGPDGCFWTFNDSGGEAELYLIDTLGKLKRTLKINNSWNRDWEDITKDKEGNIYIGNIGNNRNNNTDLCIFKIPNPDNITSNSIDAEVIRFSFEDQYSFPPQKDSMYFDCEALMWYNGHLYLSTKNRTEPFDALTHLYKLPDTAGTYVAKKISSFDTGGENMFGFWITSGDISPDGATLALLSSDKIWLFTDFIGDDFYSGKNELILLPHNTQKEAICFSGNKSIYITDELWKNRYGGKLYLLKLDKKED